MVSGQRRTVNIHTGRKLLGKTRDEILEEIIKCFQSRQIVAVQYFPESVRVTFDSEETAYDVLKLSSGVRLLTCGVEWMEALPPP